MSRGQLTDKWFEGWNVNHISAFLLTNTTYSNHLTTIRIALQLRQSDSKRRWIAEMVEYLQRLALGRFLQRNDGRRWRLSPRHWHQQHGQDTRHSRYQGNGTDKVSGDGIFCLFICLCLSWWIEGNRIQAIESLISLLFLLPVCLLVCVTRSFIYSPNARFPASGAPSASISMYWRCTTHVLPIGQGR